MGRRVARPAAAGYRTGADRIGLRLQGARPAAAGHRGRGRRAATAPIRRYAGEISYVVMCVLAVGASGGDRRLFGPWVGFDLV
ncbi:hypothetical protein, partial [Streptomyces hygroscopicus]|uniref:hypothetical protein n=1 Tax=Streptomyces hygroscopicus TaxID=1912 RepID=UPI001BDF43BF